MKDHYIYVDKARYATSIVAKYLDTAKVNASEKFYETTFPYDMIFTKADASTSNEQVEKLTREFNICYRACIGSLGYLLSTRVDLSFAVHRFARFPSNSGKLHFEGLVHLLRYIRYNRTLGLKYYADINDATVSDLLRQAGINTVNQLMDFSDYIWKDFADTSRRIGAFNIFYKGGTIDNVTHVPGLVSQSGA